MNRISVKVLSITTILCLANWSSEETSVGGKKKLAVNFYGTLKTWKGKTQDVDNIAIAHSYKDIQFYETQLYNENLDAVKELFEESKPKKSPESNSNLSDRYALKENPLDGIITKFDLVNIKEIRTPNPDVIWTYQKSKSQSKSEYIEVEIISADKTKATYLIDTRRKITCDLVACKDGQAVSEAVKDVPFKDVMSLVIGGHADRDASGSKPRPCTKQKSKKVKSS